MLALFHTAFSEMWPAGKVTVPAKLAHRGRREAMIVDVHERVTKLKSESDSVLADLPAKSSEEVIHVDGREYSTITWHDVLSDGSHRIVVARYDKHVGRVRADGFVLESDGTRRSLTDDEMFPFI